MAAGHDIRTVEGLAAGGTLDPVQQGFMEEHGLQCGFCTPGMMLTARALLDKNPHPDDTEIRQAISGQICRCTGYATIVRSVQWAAAHPAGTSPEDAPTAEEVLDGTDTAVPDVAAETANTATEVKA
jgi:carbon-monoxide dehydrogenase small subunit